MAYPLSVLFVGYKEELLQLTIRAMLISSISFLFTGISIYASSFFTALNNGLISALISFLRTLVIQVLAILLLPLLIGVDGIWVSIIVAEALSALISIIFLLAKKKQYNY